MPREYDSEAIVLGSHKLGDSDRVVTLFTSARGKVPTVVKGVRKVKSRFGGRLEPFTLLSVRLHEGRSDLSTLTAADTINTFAAIRDRTESLQAGLSVLELLTRTTTDHEQRPRTWNMLRRFLPVFDAAARAEGQVPALLALTLSAQLKLLLLAGFLPHVDSCASCGASEAVLDRFSAPAGGALCRDCSDEQQDIRPSSLSAMSYLLQHQIIQAPELAPDHDTALDVWHCIREICRFHIGVNLRVPPVRT